MEKVNFHYYIMIIFYYLVINLEIGVDTLMIHINDIKSKKTILYKVLKKLQASSFEQINQNGEIQLNTFS